MHPLDWYVIASVSRMEAVEEEVLWLHSDFNKEGGK